MSFESFFDELDQIKIFILAIFLITLKIYLLMLCVLLDKNLLHVLKRITFNGEYKISIVRGMLILFDFLVRKQIFDSMNLVRHVLMKTNCTSSKDANPLTAYIYII